MNKEPIFVARYCAVSLIDVCGRLLDQKSHFNHWPYSPDMAPSNLCLFGNIHLPRKGMRYAEEEDTLKACRRRLFWITLIDFSDTTICSVFFFLKSCLLWNTKNSNRYDGICFPFFPYRFLKYFKCSFNFRNLRQCKLKVCLGAAGHTAK